MRGDFNTAAFYAALDAQRTAKRLTWKDVAAQAGVSASTLTRMSQGRGPDVDGLACLIAWSGLNATDFIKKRPNEAEPLAQITAYLRADRNLEPESAKALEDIIRAAYERFRER